MACIMKGMFNLLYACTSANFSFLGFDYVLMREIHGNLCIVTHLEHQMVVVSPSLSGVRPALSGLPVP